MNTEETIRQAFNNCSDDRFKSMFELSEELWQDCVVNPLHDDGLNGPRLFRRGYLAALKENNLTLQEPE